MNFVLRPKGQTRPPHLLLAVSSHGFGHLSQAAPVVNQLKKLIPNLRLTVRAAFPKDQIKTRIFNPDILQPVADDFGMIMRDALTIDLPASLKTYESFHAAMPDKVARLAQDLTDQQVDLVLSDIPYLTLAAAQKAGIPNLALCSLNWADILEYGLTEYRTLYSSTTQVETSLIHIGSKIVNDVRLIYQKTNHFLMPAPSMPMTSLTNTMTIGPVCNPGMNRRSELIQAIPSSQNKDSWLVLVGMGGMPIKLDLNHWPIEMLGKSLHYVVADAIAQRTTHPHVIAESNTNLNYADLVASVDLIITKPGYGMFAEAAAAGVPVLYIERPNWPEANALTSWLQSVAHCTEIPITTLHQGDFAQEMQQLLQLGRYTPISPTGNLEAANLLARYLHSTEQAFHE